MRSGWKTATASLPIEFTAESEGLRLVLRRAFGELGLHRVEANIQPANAPSRVPS